MPQRGIEGGEHALAFQHTGVGQCIEQRRLAGIGIADEGDGSDRRGFAAPALLPADAADIFQLLLDMANAAIDLAAIGFQLSFARAAGADAAAQLRHLHAASCQSRQQVLQLRQFHLELAFAGAGVAGEDVEDKLGAVEDAGIQFALQVALLRGR